MKPQPQQWPHGIKTKFTKSRWKALYFSCCSAGIPNINKGRKKKIKACYQFNVCSKQKMDFLFIIARYGNMRLRDKWVTSKHRAAWFGSLPAVASSKWSAAKVEADLSWCFSGFAFKTYRHETLSLHLSSNSRGHSREKPSTGHTGMGGGL